MKLNSNLKTGGIYHLDCFKDEATRQLYLKTKDKSLILWSDDIKQGVTDEGLTYLNNTIFYTGTKLSDAWHLGLVVGDTAFDHAMTYATPVFVESEADTARPSCAFATSSANKCSNTASPAVFTNGGATETINGMALFGANAVGVATAGDHAASGGVLFSYGELTSQQPWVAGNVINSTYEITSATT
jgi:hypothetical protein